ncbi:hypothetical protein AAY473_024085 [Plecturocebus cupreus]
MRPGPQAAAEAGKKQLSLRPLTARAGWGGLAGVRLLRFPSWDPLPEPARGPSRGTRGASFSTQAPPDVGKANNRGNAEKQKAICHDPSRQSRKVPAGGSAERVGKEGREAPERFRVSGTCQAPGVGAVPSLQWSEARFVRPFYAPHLQEASSAPEATQRTARSSPTLPGAETPPSGSGRPSVVPQPRRTFVKSVFPPPHSPAGTRRRPRLGMGSETGAPRKEDDLIDLYLFKSRPRIPGWKEGDPSSCREVRTRSRPEAQAPAGPGKPAAGRQGTGPPPPAPPAPAPRCAPHLAARLAEIPSEQPPGCAASPRSERALTHRGVLPPAQGPVGSLRRVSGSQRERKRVSSRQVGNRLPVHARDSAAGARGPSEPTGGRASAWLQLQPPLRSSPHMHPARRAAGRDSTVSRGRRAGTPGGRLWNGSFVGRKVVFAIIFPSERDGK